MSQNLYYCPVLSDKTPVGGTQLRDILLPYGIECAVLKEEDREFLRGLGAAGVLGATDLMKAIRRHCVIRVWRAD